MRSFSRIIVGFVFLALTGPAIADEPLGPPEKFTVTSSDGSTVAIADPVSGAIAIHRAKTGEEIWSIPSWHRWIFLSNDGKHAVTGYDGMNLIPQGFEDSLVLFTFWQEGKKVREVTVREFIPKRSILKRTVSHYHWGTIRGIDEKDRLVVQRADGKVVRFRLADGKEE